MRRRGEERRAPGLWFPMHYRRISSGRCEMVLVPSKVFRVLRMCLHRQSTREEVFSSVRCRVEDPETGVTV